MQIQNQFQLGPYVLRVGHDLASIQSCNIMPGQLEPQALYDGPVSALGDRIATQLSAYLSHRCATFDLPLAPQGTPFQNRVWHQLIQIPAGQPLTYGQLASQLATAAQPIGGACKANPIGFFIPCHRIVAAQAIGGYAGAWGQGPQLDIKRWLLQHERGFMRDAG